MSSLNKGQFYRHPVSVGRDGVGPYSGVGMGRLAGPPIDTAFSDVIAADLAQLANPWMPDVNPHLTWAPNEQGIMVSASSMPNLPITTQISNWINNNQTLAIVAGFGIVGLLLLKPRRGR